MTTVEVIAPTSRPPRFTAPPLPAQEGDGNEWTNGRCWLYCEEGCLPVVWIGAAQFHGAAVPLYACAPCLRRLTNQLHATIRAKDRPTYRVY